MYKLASAHTDRNNIEALVASLQANEGKSNKYVSGV